LHLGEGEEQGIINREVLLGTKPYSKNWDPRRNIMLNSLNELKKFSPNKRIRITERDLENADIWFLPASNPSYMGWDQSVIGAYGQDNWACAFSLLHAFLETKKPEYTKIAIFYNGEERGDSGRGSFSGKYLNDIVIPALTNFRHETDPNMWRMMMKGWSLFLDATGPINPNMPDMHDPLDGSYFGSGMTIIPRGGGTGGENGYDVHPEHLSKIRRLFDDAKVDYQLASMGTIDNLIENASDIFHSDIYSHGIDLGIPLQGMHRPTELVCAIDLWNLTKGIQTVYGAVSY